MSTMDVFMIVCLCLCTWGFIWVRTEYIIDMLRGIIKRENKRRKI
jgi:hypothetical protein